VLRDSAGRPGGRWARRVAGDRRAARRAGAALPRGCGVGNLFAVIDGAIRGRLWSKPALSRDCTRRGFRYRLFSDEEGEEAWSGLCCAARGSRGIDDPAPRFTIRRCAGDVKYFEGHAEPLLRRSLSEQCVMNSGVSGEEIARKCYAMYGIAHLSANPAIARVRSLVESGIIRGKSRCGDGRADEGTECA